jgi:hypothetical protein
MTALDPNIMSPLNSAEKARRAGYRRNGVRNAREQKDFEELDRRYRATASKGLEDDYLTTDDLSDLSDPDKSKHAKSTGRIRAMTRDLRTDLKHAAAWLLDIARRTKADNKPRSLGRMAAVDQPHSLNRYPEHAAGPDDLVEIHNHMPQDEAPQPEKPSEAWQELREKNEHGNEPPPWFAQHKAETDDRFRSLHDAMKSLHDRLQELGNRAHGDDETVFDPEAETTGHVEREDEGIDPDDLRIIENVNARLQRAGDAKRITTLRELNARNRAIHHPRRTGDTTKQIGRPKSLADVNVYMKHHYAKPVAMRK